MQFSDDDLHETMKVALESLLSVIKDCQDFNIKGNAAIHLANLVLELWDRSHPQIEVIEAEEIDEDDENLEY